MIIQDIVKNSKNQKNLTQKTNNAILTETYNTATAEAYLKAIRGLIRDYYTIVSEAAINEFIATGDFAELTALELLARSGFDLHNIEQKNKQIATEMVKNIQQQSSAKFRIVFREAKKPLPNALKPKISKSLIESFESKNTQNLISQQVQKIKGLEEYQYSKINSALQEAIVEQRSLSQFKQSLKECSIYNEKRIKMIAYNQLHYATDVMYRNKSLELGFKNAIWRHPPPGRYKTEGRPSHIAADGKTFRLDKGCLIDGEYIFCGEKINCKCYYQLII